MKGVGGVPPLLYKGLGLGEVIGAFLKKFDEMTKVGIDDVVLNGFEKTFEPVVPIGKTPIALQRLECHLQKSNKNSV